MTYSAAEFFHALFLDSDLIEEVRSSIESERSVGEVRFIRLTEESDQCTVVYNDGEHKILNLTQEDDEDEEDEEMGIWDF